jgi:hypothetical protein
MAGDSMQKQPMVLASREKTGVKVSLLLLIEI